jgi:hypothetical protein
MEMAEHHTAHPEMILNNIIDDNGVLIRAGRHPGYFAPDSRARRRMEPTAMSGFQGRAAPMTDCIKR